MLKKISFYVLLLFLASLLFISFFNRFQTDDYVLAWDFRHFGFIGSIKNTYLVWSGRYFAFTIIKLTPLLFHQYEIYPTASVIFSIFLLWSGVFLLFKNYFKNTIKESIVKSIMFCSIYFSLSLNLAEHLYWHAGAKVYLFPFTYFLFLLNTIIANNRNPKRIYIVLAYILTFMIIGSNEIIAVMLCSFLFFVQQKNKHYRHLFIFSILLLMFSFLAPGNFVRMENRTEQTIFNIIKRRVLLLGGINGVIAIKSIFLIPLFHLFFSKEIRLLQTQKMITKILLIAFIGMSLVVLLGVGAQRTSDTYLIFYIIGLASLIHLKYDLKKWTWATLVIICLPSIKIKKQLLTFNYHLYDAVTDIIHYDRLRGYKKQLTDRERFLESTTQDSVQLKTIQNLPNTLYFHKIGTKYDKDFSNKQLELFYNKKAVFIGDD